jgi:integrase
MSPRKRSPINAGLPPGLRVRNGLYSWTHPIDKREKGLGRNRVKAIQWARQANAIAESMRGEPSVEEWVRGVSAKSWGAWLERYQQLLDERESTKATRNQRKSLTKRARAQWPAATGIGSIDTAMVADAIRELTSVGKQRMAQSYRSYLSDCFACSIAEGWRKDNPVDVTRAVTVKTKRARLTIEHFRTIYADENTKPWLRNAMALALVSGQRREDIARAQRRDVREGCWWVEQHKTGNRVAIPVSIRLESLGMSLAEVLKQCSGTSILSPYLIHQTFRGGGSKPGARIAIRAYTNYFTACVKRLGLDWGEKSPPTFHELRSLSKRLYDAQGGVDTKQLLGHKSASAAALYQDARGEWVRVSVTTG